MVSVQPQGVADDSKRLMSVLFLLREDTAEDGVDAEGREDACGEAGGGDFFGSSASGEFEGSGGEAAKRGERCGGLRIAEDVAGSDGSARTAPQVFSQQNEAVGIVEWERTQEDAFDKREDSRSGADAESQCDDHGKGEAWRFAQLAKCKAEILFDCAHASYLAPKSGSDRVAKIRQC